MKVYKKIAELIEENKSFTIATVVDTRGSVPGKIGFKMVVDREGKSFGTVGGGELEQRVVAECIARLERGESGLREYLLQEKAGSAKKGQAEVIPMMCNGKVWVYYEVVRNRPSVFVFGGGHVGQALSYFLSKLNYHLILIDNREEFAREEVNPYFHERNLADYVAYAGNFEPDPGAFILIMTQGHGFDYEILAAILKRKITVKYIGIIASRSKAEALIRKVKENFGDGVDLSNIFTPVGIDIGGSTESEIALSIAAELQAIRYGKAVNHLRI